VRKNISLRNVTQEHLGPRRGLEDNIRMDLWKIESEGVDWIHLARDTDQWRAVVNTVTKLRVP
jgi:hypothetical protein